VACEWERLVSEFAVGLAMVWDVDYEEPDTPQELTDLLGRVLAAVARDQVERHGEDESRDVRRQLILLERVIADIFVILQPPQDSDPEQGPVTVEYTEVPNLVRRVVADRDHLRTACTALVGFAGHEDCAIFLDGICTCGLDDVLRQVGALS
jgi:hypothetical protein